MHALVWLQFFLDNVVEVAFCLKQKFQSIIHQKRHFGQFVLFINVE